MAAYYNEIDPYAAQWLRNLIAAGYIAPGDVDERSITEVTLNDIKHYTQCHFFAGIGIWSHALRQSGWSDDRPIWTGSCPCQPFSVAGKKNGFDDERHLWSDWYRLIRECRPGVIVGEQVSSKDALFWFDLVQSDLEKENYTSAGIDICAAGVGAPHIRQRLYWMACTRLNKSSRVGNPDIKRLQGWENIKNSDKGTLGATSLVSNDLPVNRFWRNADWIKCRDEKWRAVESGTFPLVDGYSTRMESCCAKEQIKCYGNAIVAPLATQFIKSCMELL